MAGPSLEEELRRAGVRVVARAEDHVRQRHPGIEPTSIRVTADARELLVALSRRAALLVVGARGLGRVRALLLGSVSSAVVRQAHCPVVVVRAPVDPATAHGVLVGIGGTAASVATLEFAFRAASWRGDGLTVLHCVGEAITAQGHALAAPPHTDHQEERLVVSETLASLRERYPDIAITVQLDHGLAEQALADLTHDRALVVVGSRPHGALLDLVLGSVATALTEHARCPVAVVPHDPRLRAHGPPDPAGER
ncbi:universal stress protein [Nocardioides humi]|uniref:universal stress protein n=1 Tax=Nocardioides humi TaxID=449461 RepID=UPI0015E84B2C|nr:universal stress protein [Nocardioides humi]